MIIYSSPDDKKKNRGFCFLEYESHKVSVVDCTGIVDMSMSMSMRYALYVSKPDFIKFFRRFSRKGVVVGCPVLFITMFYPLHYRTKDRSWIATICTFLMPFHILEGEHHRLKYYMSHKISNFCCIFRVTRNNSMEYRGKN